ncbi:MAG: right-handed parallel beta-helix repeat-containing protein [Thermoplasmata archaeon]
MRTRKAASAVLCSLLFIPGFIPAALATNDPPPGGGTVTGDWTVTDTRSYSGVTINCNGNLIVSGSGNLTLDGVTLNIRSTASNIYGIEVRSGGKLYLKGGTQVSNGGGNANFRFIIQSGAAVRIQNTTISRCGVMGPGTGRGVYIASDDVVIENSTIRNGYEGVHIEYASPKILNTTVHGHDYYAIYVDHGFPTVDGCTIYNCGHYGGAPAILVENSNSSSAVCRISNCTIRDNEHGVYFNLDSPGVLENCTVLGQTFRGVWVRQSRALVRGNNITRNKEFGIFLEESSSTIEGNSITYNGQSSQPAAGVYVYLTSNPLIQDNYLALNNDTGITVRAYCAPVIKNNVIAQNTNRGIRLDHAGPALITGNNISSNYDGLHCDGVSGAVIERNVIWSNGNDGLHAQGSSSLSFEGNNVTGSGMCGVHATGPVSLTIANSTFSGLNQFGVSAENGASALIVNCNFSDEYREAIKADATSTLDWVVDSRAAIDGDDAVLMGNLTVRPGGRLLLRDSLFQVGSSVSVRRAVLVDAGGELELERCNLTALDPGHNYRFSCAGVLRAANSSLGGAGWDWGTDGETAGVHLAGTAEFTYSTITASFCGLVLRSGSAILEGTRIQACEACAVDARRGVLEMRNSTISGNSQHLIQLDLSSRAELLNTTFDAGRTLLKDGASVLNVSWFASGEVRWSTGAPVPGATLTLRSAQGAMVFSGETDELGRAGPFAVQEFSLTSASKTSFTPHTVRAVKGGLSAQEEVRIDHSLSFGLTLVDPTPPELEISSPEEGAYLNMTVVEFRGRASDPESGVLRVEVSWNNLTWDEADTGDGFATWNHTFELNEMAYTLRARAINSAGLTSSARVNITIRTALPILVVESPREGLLTNLTPLPVTGRTSLDAVVSVQCGGCETLAQNFGGRFSALVPLQEGLNCLVVSSRDPAGNTNSTMRNVTLDTIPPYINLALPRVSYTSNQSIEVTGTTDAAAVTVNGMVATLENGTFKKTVILNSGPGTTNTSIEIVAQDAAGNTNRTVVYVIRDLLQPPLTIDHPPLGLTLTNQTTIWLNGSTEPGALVTLNDKPIPVDSRGFFSVLVELVEGENVLIVVATDAAGNARSLQRTVQRDTVSPPLEITSPLDGLHTFNLSVDVIGATEPGARVVVNGKPVTVGAGGSFSLTGLSLALGANDITVSASDAAGNTVVKRLRVFRDEPPLPPPPQPPEPGPKRPLDLYLPYLLILIVVLGGAGAVAWTFAGYRRSVRRAQRMRASAGTHLGPRATPGWTGSPGRPQSADELYAKDYAARRRASSAQPSAPVSWEESPQPRESALPVESEAGVEGGSWRGPAGGDAGATWSAEGRGEGTWPEALAGAREWVSWESGAKSAEAAGGGGAVQETARLVEHEEAGGAEETPTPHGAPEEESEGPAHAGAARAKVDEDIDELLKRFREVGKGGK